MVAGIPEKYTDAQDNESTSFLPGDAESTKALTAAEELQGGELAPAVIIYRRESGLTDADKAKIATDVKAMARSGSRRSWPTARPRRPVGRAATTHRRRFRRARAAADRRRRSRASRPTSRRSSVPSVARPDGKAALVFAYVKGDGEIDSIRDPMQFWRETVSNPGGGLEVKITGPAGYAADAIEVFEGINGTLLGAATLLVIVLLILIYRSPIFTAQSMTWPRP